MTPYFLFVCVVKAKNILEFYYAFGSIGSIAFFMRPNNSSFTRSWNNDNRFLP